MVALHLNLEVIMNNSLGKEYWQRHIQRCIETGSTQAAYCRKHDLVTHQFGYWFRKFSNQAPASWLPVVVEQVVVSTSIELALRGERVLHIHAGFDEQLLSQIIVAVESTP